MWSLWIVFINSEWHHLSRLVLKIALNVRRKIHLIILKNFTSILKDGNFNKSLYLHWVWRIPIKIRRTIHPATKSGFTGKIVITLSLHSLRIFCVSSFFHNFKLCKIPFTGPDYNWINSKQFKFTFDEWWREYSGKQWAR